MGINIPTKEELIANKPEFKDIAGYIGKPRCRKGYMPVFGVILTRSLLLSRCGQREVSDHRGPGVSRPEGNYLSAGGQDDRVPEESGSLHRLSDREIPRGAGVVNAAVNEGLRPANYTITLPNGSYAPDDLHSRLLHPAHM